MKNKIRVTLEDQPLEFIRRQPPQARNQLRKALHNLENGSRFPEALEDELDGFYKLRVEGYRFILQSVKTKEGPGFRVVFAEKRKVVYELFSQILGLD